MAWGTKGESLLVMFDDLCRDSEVLREASEHEFLGFLNSVERYKEKVSNSELQVHQLTIELAKAAQENSGLQTRLENARRLLDNESTLRRKAETERDRLASQLDLLRRLVLDDNIVDKVTLDKIRNIDDYIETSACNVLSESLQRELKRDRRSGGSSVYDVDDISFIDDTLDLCESRTRSGATYKNFPNQQAEYSSPGSRRRRSKRSRSASRQPENSPLESMATPKRPRKKRSRSVVGFKDPIVERSKDENEERGEEHFTPADRVKTPEPILKETEHSGNHRLKEKTVMKLEYCTVCDQRIKFGKNSLKCLSCKLIVHMECIKKAHPLCTQTEEDVAVSMTPSGHAKSPHKKPYFASPMLK